LAAAASAGVEVGAADGVNGLVGYGWHERLLRVSR
jgi:hypothetical protein